MTFIFEVPEAHWASGEFQHLTAQLLMEQETDVQLLSPPDWQQLRLNAVFDQLQNPSLHSEVNNPEEITMLVNKERSLPADFSPEDLTVPEVHNFGEPEIREEAAAALEEMFAAAEEDGLQIIALSGYRSYDRQEEIFDNNVAEHGLERTLEFSARPGESEHQSGLSMDVSSPELSESGDYLSTKFGDTSEGEWIAEHASDYGYIIRYEEGKEDITGYQYEPWHLRYVGVENAQYIDEHDLTLEEFSLPVIY
ncbi:M15 family metallopeptidase [Alkalicoccus daliensis]|uniref:D-alanyl-D-alanine carboxypeptidase n=1 Tax=Alkalicoccus daliensis TaxID=745820 RepID=A0A1H0FV07_9BACI|nr:M15 family metallopeptidase [Alkalicoccus daliensis]SDN98483.1 D-alanyl-D-alanine carboxypeptidase [Alkalicoccus daliensis]